MKNETATLLPCPFCGEALTINNANLGAHPRFSECIYAQQVVVADDAAQVAKWNTRAALADPVPPAGGEPIKRFTTDVYFNGGNTYVKEVEFANGHLVRYQHHVDYVTRLQAEVEQWKRAHRLAMQDNIKLQSELTKARELLADVAKKPWMYDVLGSVREYIDHQSAPSAKDGHPSCNNEREDYGLPTDHECRACGRGPCIDR